MEGKYLFWIFVILRIISIFVVRTYYVPDEYWQSLEVAHKAVFGYGYLTWEWKDSAIRSGLYPSLFVLLYKTLQILRLDYRNVLIISPRVLQAFLTSVGDVFTVKLSDKLYGSGSAKWTALSIMTSWFLFYCGSRTLANTMETALTAVALYHYPFRKQRYVPRVFIGLAALTFIIRPTSAILWLPLVLVIIFTTEHLTKLLINLASTGLASLMLCCLCDRLFYNRWVLTLYNFAHFNVMSGLSDVYGTHPWHWYVSQGFPAVMSTHLLPFALSLRRGRWRSLPAFLVLWQLFIYSLIPHKEFRFIMPVLPLAFCLVGKYLSTIDDKKNLWNARNVVIVMAIVNLCCGLFFGLVWGRGPLEAMVEVANEVDRRPSNSSVLILMPCHSMPLYSHLHVNVSVRFLTCEPNLSHLNGYVDEADEFYQNPKVFIESKRLLSTLPDLIVMFHSLKPVLDDFLMLNNYTLCRMVQHYGMPDRRKSDQIHIYCK